MDVENRDLKSCRYLVLNAKTFYDEFCPVSDDVIGRILRVILIIFQSEHIHVGIIEWSGGAQWVTYEFDA